MVYRTQKRKIGRYSRKQKKRVKKGGSTTNENDEGENDTEGNEIYLGDVLTSDFVGSELQTVIFKDGMFTLDDLTFGCQTLDDEISQCGGHRVIGNIYENIK